MKNKNPFLLLSAAGMMLFAAPAMAQVNYYQTPQYQAEEQAFRARQNEGARLHEMFGEQSPQYQSWYAREKGVSPMYGYNPYYGYSQPLYGAPGPQYFNTYSSFQRQQAKRYQQYKKHLRKHLKHRR